jgi:hypothetical protein
MVILPLLDLILFGEAWNGGPLLDQFEEVVDAIFIIKLLEIGTGIDAEELGIIEELVEDVMGLVELEELMCHTVLKEKAAELDGIFLIVGVNLEPDPVP